MLKFVKKVVSISITLCFLLLFTVNYSANAASILGTASDFSIFVLNNHVHHNSDVTGRVAVGNDAEYANYSIGTSLKTSTTRSDLIVGHSLSATGGNNFNGNTSVGGEIKTYSMTNNNGSKPKIENVIDFTKEKKYLYDLSQKLKALKSNGSVTNTYGQINFSGDNKDLIIFNVNASDLYNANGLNMQVPSTATVLVNVLGDTIKIGNLGMFQNMKTPESTTFTKWLWNFPDAHSLDLYGISFKGTILAPYATANITGSGNVEGTVILENFINNNAGLEVHNYLFNGNIKIDSDKPADKPSDKPSDKPADKPSDKPSDKPADKPSDKPSDKPTSTVEKVIEKTIEKPVIVVEKYDTTPKTETTITKPDNIFTNDKLNTSNTSIPKTGDNQYIYVGIAVLTSGLLCLVLYVLDKRKKR